MARDGTRLLIQICLNFRSSHEGADRPLFRDFLPLVRVSSSKPQPHYRKRRQPGQHRLAVAHEHQAGFAYGDHRPVCLRAHAAPGPSGQHHARPGHGQFDKGVSGSVALTARKRVHAAGRATVLMQDGFLLPMHKTGLHTTSLRSL